MTPEQIKIIKLSFAPLMGRKAEVGKLFYQRLFEIAPETRSMFKSDLNVQAEKLMRTLSMMISSLQDTAALTKVLEGLGSRHIGYGVRDEHYDKVGAALLWTLEKGLGDAYTAEAKVAWSELYAIVAKVMTGAERPATAVNG